MATETKDLKTVAIIGAVLLVLVAAGWCAHGADARWNRETSQRLQHEREVKDQEREAQRRADEARAARAADAARSDPTDAGPG